ncbi:DNA mismatch repair endonuclease MutL [Engelhardtia mirabilis]|uniref:DNA mismatch repair protein MutL n=1 Tax=Engelhardtia mirabilis TaxID=2528011 RepID=A0A518BJD3_9BACT|nr:DNA mismatch repair protein MutL [Planctomycetes bacterium Pla133]QDV01380.1 DNA mismatch repair protein MutL [Planctomycetes bacterium Pla86]
MATETNSVIRELPEVVRNQIAAGEVVERPASVVKELVENALDAGARNVRIDLEEGGVRLIRVTDDGSGMGATDLALALTPHATSKLHELADLDHIASLGFRGEALASIGAVARVRILSRTADLSTGFEIREEGGKRSEVHEAGAPLGTSIEVRDLFYNTPARRRFLKRTQTELGRCLDLIQRLALAHVGVGFVATHDGRRLYDVEPEMDLRDRVRRTFGAELADSLVPVEIVDGPIRLSGLVAPPRFARRDQSRQMWFLNGRPLRDKVLTRVVKEGYRGFLEEGRQPAAFLALSMPPERVDVNVHPMKTEVRFRDERPLFGFLVNALRAAVAETDIATPGEKLLGSAEKRGGWTPPTEHPGQRWLPASGAVGWSGGGSGGSSGSSSGGSGAGGLAHQPPPFHPGGPSFERGVTPQSPDRLEVVELRPREQGAGPAVLGRAPQAGGHGASGSDGWAPRDDFSGPYLQVAKTYVVRAVPEGFEIVDQHALHERLTYEGLREELRRGSIAVQRMLVPEVVELGADEVALLEEHLEAIARLGIELSVFGPDAIAVQGLPARLRNPDAAGIVRDLLAIMGTRGKLPEAEDVLEEVLHRTACRSSVMAGDVLDQGQMRALLERAAQLETDQTCPHARPTRVRFTIADLERAFHRR